jgi:hypothetical protein
MENKKGSKKLSIHITKDNKKIDEVFLEWNDSNPEFTQKYLNKSIKFMEEYAKLFEKYKLNIKNLDEKNTICYDCLIKHDQLKLDTKTKAKESFNSIIKKLKKENLYLNFKDCKKSEHNILMNIKTGQMYRQTSFGLFTFLNTEKFIEEFGRIFEEVFKEEMQWLENAKNQLSTTLERYKLK